MPKAKVDPYKALGHPMRRAILDHMNGEPASPKKLSRELKEGLSRVSYHVTVLRDCDALELVKTKPRRGAVEHFYRAKPWTRKARQMMAGLE